MSLVNNGAGKITEECGELLQLIGKYLAYPDGNHPDRKGHLFFRLEDEIGDVYAAIEYFASEINLDLERIKTRKKEKLSTFYEWKTKDGQPEAVTLAKV